MIAAGIRQYRGRLREAEPMAKHTSWRVGGPADIYYEPADVEDLAAFVSTLADDTEILWLGLGSNLLVRDGGWRGAVIATHKALDSIERISATRVRVEAGVACAKLARQCAGWRLGPAEFFAGIPGTIGGALAMNAGAFGGDTWSYVESVETLDREGSIHQRLRGEYEVSYRTVIHPLREWFIAATFVFSPGTGEGRRDIREMLARRKRSQPIGLPSCGSVFRNPDQDHAARLIEACGLKGYQIGGAEVSPKHANFIINTGTATAADIERLIEHVKETVKQQQGVELEPEVRIVGVAADA